MFSPDPQIALDTKVFPCLNLHFHQIMKDKF